MSAAADDLRDVIVPCIREIAHAAETLAEVTAKFEDLTAKDFARLAAHALQLEAAVREFRKGCEEGMAGKTG